MTTQSDLQAAIDLTIELRPAWFPNRPKVICKTVGRGRANWKTNSITIPQWSIETGDSYALYYAIHELAHYFGGRLGGHSAMFQKIEDELLSIWGLSIKRAKAYPKALFANGQPQPCG